MGSGSHNSDTIPRNPFRGLGETPEEILARLQAKNVVSATGSTPPPGTTPSAPVLPPSAPALPISIGKPILRSSAPATAPEAAPPAPAPRADSDNPLLQRLTGLKPVQLLSKHVDHNSPDFEKLKAEIEKTDEAAILRSVQSFNGVNLALELQKLPAPTLLLHGRGDTLLDAPTDDLMIRISKGKPEGHLLAFVEDDLKHFPMLEITAKFNRLLMDFFEAQDLTNVQFKDQWRRTMR
jgi:pimeloyl-ACP methyl ester carboxylesterase